MKIVNHEMLQIIHTDVINNLKILHVLIEKDKKGEAKTSTGFHKALGGVKMYYTVFWIDKKARMKGSWMKR